MIPGNGSNTAKWLLDICVGNSKTHFIEPAQVSYLLHGLLSGDTAKIIAIWNFI